MRLKTKRAFHYTRKNIEFSLDAASSDDRRVTDLLAILYYVKRKQIRLHI